MQSETSSALSQKPLPQPKPATSATSAMLTHSEIEQLRQAAKDNSAYLQEVYPNLKIAR